MALEAGFRVAGLIVVDDNEVGVRLGVDSE